MPERLPRLWNASNGSQDNNNWGSVLNAWLLVAHNTDGTIDTTITGVTAGLLADRPASPSVGNVYVATDTNQFFYCAVAGTWREAVELTLTQTLTNKTLTNPRLVSPNGTVYTLQVDNNGALTTTAV